MSRWRASTRGRAVERAHRGGTAGLMVAALGVVFGDIGTSPLYALAAVFSVQHHALRPTQAAVYGVISLVFWTLTLVVSVKYVTFIMRADNDGEGGIMALIALVMRAPLRGRRLPSTLVALGILGVALFYGDATITPAISVLSAVEGLDVAAPSLASLIVPVALVVLTALFAVQRYGTEAVGRLFGPVMALWFAALAVSGLRQVVERPDVLSALSPAYGAGLLADHAAIALPVMGAVVLTVTGAEALYADIGHFGRGPIRRAWLLVVAPALVLNYMGQGRLILDSPSAIEDPLFLMMPGWARMPMVVLATTATVIASQAVISGAFSVTHQAVELGYLPRLTIRHTSEREVGQVYVPAVTWALWLAVAGLVVGFGSSGRLAAAYGVAVTGTMTATSVLFLVVMRARWSVPWPAVLVAGAAFLTLDLGLLAATLTKVRHGGWLPLCVALVLFTVLTTWRRGCAIVTRNRIRREGSLRRFVEEMRERKPAVHRAPGTAVFLSLEPDTTPLALRGNVRHNDVLHENVVILVVCHVNVPHVGPADRVTVDDLGYRDDGITHLTARYGFRDRTDVPATLALAAQAGAETRVDAESVSYFISRITLLPTTAPGLRPWRKALFIALARNEADPAWYFALPDERTVTMGSVIAL